LEYVSAKVKPVWIGPLMMRAHFNDV
jgi:hypothetical protein